ncbi:MAG: DUF1499 domain-containing protein [Xanthomonadaceae bacterium]|nr:DUF1499 domain-containing protein [Xanthomonadaceae bacterium]MDE3072086.1 DUF1499 domain-containing protein [Pseudomonadota bacterium]
MHTATERSAPGHALQRWSLSVAGIGVALGALAVLAVALPGPAYRCGLIGLGAAFGTIRIGAMGGIAAMAVSLPAVALALFARHRRYALYAVFGLLLGAFAFVPPWLLVRKARSLPAIHDISTDTVDPPRFEAILALRAKAPNSPVYGGAGIAAKQHAAYPDIQPLILAHPAAEVLAAARKVALAMGWRIVAEQADAGRLEATATTPWFGFKDDVVIRVRPAGNGSRLDIRSESRLGGSDVGANAARIRRFAARLRHRLDRAGS